MKSQTIVASVFLFFVLNAFGQDAEVYGKTVNRLVELVNAADYSGLENLFDKEMSKALPLEKAKEFFTGPTEQVGKLQKLDEPKPIPSGLVFPAHCERGGLDMTLALNDPKQNRRS
jgi:hypothetical protein